MATVQIPFQPYPARPTLLGHRFSSSPMHTFPSPPPPNTFSHPYANKRRHEDEPGEDEREREAREDERGARRVAGGKRAKRVQDAARGREAGLETMGVGETKNDEDEIDVGVLLASVPESSLLPLLNALIADTPSLKAKVLSLMPRPALQAVTAAISASARKVHAAYPYSSAAAQPALFSGFGFGTPVPAPGGFGIPFGSAIAGVSGLQNQQPRDTYARARLRAPLSEHITTILSYLPHFTPSPSLNPSKAPPHPSESFTFLSTATLSLLHLLSLFPPPAPPPQPLLDALARLHAEFGAWSRAVDEHVNAKGGMYGQDMVRAWASQLDEIAALGGGDWARVRDAWVARCGWLIGRRVGDAGAGYAQEDVEL